MMDNKLDEMDKLYRGMFKDEEVVKFMFVRDNAIQKNDYYTVLQIVNKLGLIYDRQSSITDIYLYFPASASIITPTYRLYAKTFFDRILEREDISYDQWTSLLGEGYIELSNVYLNGGPDDEYLYFAKTMYITTDEQYSPVIFFSISKDSIRQTAEDLFGASGMTVQILDDKDGSVIFDGGADGKDPYIELSSAVENMSYRIYYPVNSFANEYKDSLRYILISTVIGFLINIGVAVYLAYRNYRPIQSILTRIGNRDRGSLQDENEFVQLQTIMDRTFARNEEMRPVYTQYYLRQMLEGHIRMTQPVLNNIASAGIDLLDGWFQIFEVILTEERDGQTDLSDTIRKLTEEYPEDRSDIYYISHENTSLTVLLQYPQKPDVSRIRSEAEKIQKRAEKTLGQPIAIYVSRIMDRASELPEVYQQAERARIYAGWSGYTGILTYEDFMHEQAGTFRYSIDDELQLINSIRSGETDRVSEEVDRLFQISASQIKEDDPQNITAVRGMMIHLMSTYLKVAQQLGLEEESFNYDMVLTNSPQQARGWCIQAFCRLADQERDKYDKNSKAVRLVQDHIAEHYADDDLGLATLADVAGLSPAYLSTLFKQNTGMNLSDHINRVRIDHAKEKLIENDTLTIHEVASCCGFYSDATFARVFKKLEGITPGEYRKTADTRQ